MRKVEDDLIEVRPKDLNARLNLLRPELDMLHRSGAGEHPEPARMLSQEASDE
jgi:hypothetical protein